MDNTEYYTNKYETSKQSFMPKIKFEIKDVQELYLMCTSATKDDARVKTIDFRFHVFLLRICFLYCLLFIYVDT